jgi:hypothetical protein
MGHSVEVLVSVYAGALEGDDREANRRIDLACRAATAWLSISTATSGTCVTGHAPMKTEGQL